MRKKTSCNRIMVVSPDTDVYHIGLPMDCIREKEIIVKISLLSKHMLKIINMRNLLHALEHDPELANIGRAILPKCCNASTFVLGVTTPPSSATLAKLHSLRYSSNIPLLFVKMVL